MNFRAQDMAKLNGQKMVDADENLQGQNEKEIWVSHSKKCI